jgi:hypothetical protein
MPLTYERMTEIIEDAGYEAEAYSGRAMYARNCAGFRTEDRMSTAMAAIIMAAGSQNEAAGVVRAMSLDAVGIGNIFYWPSAKAPKGEVA